MKITFRISKLGSGGAERVFISVAEILKKDFGAEIDFVIDNYTEGVTEEVAVSKGFNLHRLTTKRTFHSIVPFKHYIDTRKPDIIISGYTDTNMAAIISAKLANHSPRIIVSEHASMKEHWHNFAVKRKLMLKLYVKYGYRFADHILAVSKGIAESIKNMGHVSSKVSYIYNPVRFDARLSPEFKEKISDLPIILAVGRVTLQKDYSTLLKAFNLLNQNKKAKLMIVGAVNDQSEKEKLDEYIQKKNLGSKVEFVGFTEEVQQYYKSADVFVLSSAWEGFGNVIVEALAYGLPVVSTNCNHGPAEILQDGEFGQLVPVGDWKTLASALENALDNIDNVDASKLKKRSLNFSEESIAKQYWALIQRVTA